MNRSLLTLACLLFFHHQLSGLAAAEEPSGAAKKLVDDAIAAVGGDNMLLTQFRFRERVLITSTPAPPVEKDEKGNRTSVVQVGGDWWIGTEKRDKDKVRVLCWAWSLRILRDPKSRIEAIPPIVVADKPAVGLRVSESIKQPLNLYFDEETKHLVAIDEGNTRHIFSDWKKTAAGQQYASHVVGYRFVDRNTGKIEDKQWYQTDILELTPLAELPPELKP